MGSTNTSIRDNILKAAEQIFLREGFARANVRDIAKAAYISVSDIYYYFKNKNDIFCTLVQPAINEFDRIIHDHHNLDIADTYMSEFVYTSFDKMQKGLIDTFLNLINNYRTAFELLLTRAEGSSLENFTDDYIDKCTHIVVAFMNKVNIHNQQFNCRYDKLTYRLQIVWTFQLMNEIIKHKLKPKETKKAIEDYVKFEYYGWRGLIAR